MLFVCKAITPFMELFHVHPSFLCTKPTNFMLHSHHKIYHFKKKRGFPERFGFEVELTSFTCDVQLIMHAELCKGHLWLMAYFWSNALRVRYTL